MHMKADIILAYSSAACHDTGYDGAGKCGSNNLSIHFDKDSNLSVTNFVLSQLGNYTAKPDYSRIVIVIYQPMKSLLMGIKCEF